MCLFYIEFIDRIYILERGNNIKRVEGNAGQILELTPKNKPYNTVKTVFFLSSSGNSFLENIQVF